MRRLVEFPLENGSTIIVEVEDPILEGGLVRAARPDEVVTKAQLSFNQAMDKVKPSANAIIRKLRELHDPADEIQVEFGLKVSAEFGAVVAATGLEANYSVTLKWKRTEEK